MFFHATPAKNIAAIKRDGLQPGVDKHIHFTNDVSWCLYLVWYRFRCESIAVFAADVAPETWVAGTFLQAHPVPPERLTFVGVFEIDASSVPALLRT